MGVLSSQQIRATLVPPTPLGSGPTPDAGTGAHHAGAAWYEPLEQLGP